MDMGIACPECGAIIHQDNTCEDCFNQMLAWEIEDPELNYGVHHLLVLSFQLQHPSRYSPEGLMYAIQLLADFTERGITPQEVRQKNRGKVDSGNRKWKITGTPESHGVYLHPVSWRITACDIVAGGKEHYCTNVREWAQSIYDALKTSGNFYPR